MNKTLVLTGICLVVSVVIVAALFLLSDDLVHRRNNFLRQFPPHTLSEGDTIDIKYNSYYLAGGTSHHFYLGNFTAPLHMLVTNKTLTDTQQVSLKVKGIETMKFWALRLKVDSPNFYLVDGAVPIIFNGKVNDWHANRNLYDSAFFMDLEPISRTSFAIRSISSLSNEHTLGTLRADTPHVKLFPTLLQKQIDGRFCVDGMLHYDKKLARLVYLYYYRNQFIVTDTNMNLAYRGKTIDTISRAQIKIASISSEGSKTMAEPPLLVNKQSCVSGNLLFVISGLLSKNEQRETFDKSSVIDVYNLKNGEYKFSFYVPEFAGNKIRDMQVFGDKLVTLFDHYMITYNLVPKYFSEQ